MYGLPGPGTLKKQNFNEIDILSVAGDLSRLHRSVLQTKNLSIFDRHDFFMPRVVSFESRRRSHRFCTLGCVYAVQNVQNPSDPTRIACL